MCVFLRCHAGYFLVCPSTACTAAAVANACPDEITVEAEGCVCVCVRAGGDQGGLPTMEKKKNLELCQVFLLCRLPTLSSCHVASLMKQLNTEKLQKQTNK